MNHQVKTILWLLQNSGSENNRQGMARFGIDISKAYGVRTPDIRKIAKSYRSNHGLALELWHTNIHEAKILAALIDDPALVSTEQMDEWAGDFYSWDLCDQCCMNLFVFTPFAFDKITAWSQNEPEFEKRAAFALLASTAVHRKEENNNTFINYLPTIEEAAIDERNFVKKAVNWALRQIGKRNGDLHKYALQTAEKLSENKNSKSSRWIGKNALSELKTKFID